MSQPQKPESERDRRAAAVREAVSGARLQGTRPTPEWFDLAERYIDCEITQEEFHATVLAWYKQ